MSDFGKGALAFIAGCIGLVFGSYIGTLIFGGI